MVRILVLGFFMTFGFFGFSQISVWEEPPTEAVGKTADLDHGKSLHRTIMEDGNIRYTMLYWYKGRHYGFSWYGDEATEQFYQMTLMMYNQYRDRPISKKFLVGNTIVEIEVSKGQYVNAEYNFYSIEGIQQGSWKGMNLLELNKLFGKNHKS